ncbi:uncharacterized protein LOC128547516 [Mercenaria mercenaria]|uniref:uncharacterized protein LOC128547516 n=1 Tax=Mercenaria mercenaria TaxID=6596 RepID=UPI00234E7C2D|nr:uncharacterized protein LOC128547516 [Mercenaria mercenaria]
MASSGNLGNTSEETFDMLCSACKEQNINKEAEKYCVDCRDYYCSECLKLHSSLPALKGHKLLGKEAGQSRQLPMVPTERCERHDFKTVDMFCQNHDQIGCGTCIAVDHRTCQDVFYIPEFLKSRANVIPEFLQRMKNIENKFKEFLKTFSDEIDDLKANKQREIETINTFAKKLEEKIKEAQRDAISKVEERYDKLMMKINRDIDNIKREQETFETTKGFIESTVGNNSQAFVAMKLNGNKIATTEAASDGIAKIKLGRRVHFTLDPKFDEISKERMCFGYVNIIPYSFEYKGTVDIKLNSDTNSCDIYGSCVLPDGSILFADRNNENLKLIDGVALTVIDHHDLKTMPWDVCCLDDKEVGVSLDNKKKVKIFNVDQKLFYKYELSFSFSCRGISYCDNILYISDWESIYMCSLDGSILKTFASNFTPSSIYNIFVSKQCNSIFVSSEFGGKALCLSSQGNISQIISNEIIWPRGFATAYDGKVFAGGFLSDNVILLNEKGEFENVVIRKGLSRPQALCFNCHNGCLYVPSINTDSVQIFELE